MVTDEEIAAPAGRPASDNERQPLQIDVPSGAGGEPVTARYTRVLWALLGSAVLSALAVGAVVWVDEGEAAAPAASATPPHIVFLLADDLGWNDVGYQSSDLSFASPAIDGLAAGGRKLTQYYAEPICTPSRGALLSGRYPFNVGLQRALLEPCSLYGLDLSAGTLADRLAAEGYRTHMVGKWHLGYSSDAYTPLQRGFESFFGFYNGYTSYYEHEISTGNLTAKDLQDGDEWAGAATDGVFNVELFAARASELVAAHDPSEPLFLYVPLPTPHFPMDEAPAAMVQPGCADVEDETRRTFCGLVSALDWAVGNLTTALEQAGLWEDTLFVWASDNGGSNAWAGNNYPLRGDKGTHWEGGMRVPAFVAGGALDASLAGTEAAGLVHVSDWLPTLLTAAGADVPDAWALDGVSAWPLISSASGASSRDELPCLWMWDEVDGLAASASLRQGDFKLLVNPPNGTWREPGDYVGVQRGPGTPVLGTHLFNVVDDPLEEDDIAAENPDLVAAMLDRIAELEAEQGTVTSLLEADMEGCDPAATGVWEPWLAVAPVAPTL